MAWNSAASQNAFQRISFIGSPCNACFICMW